MLRMRSANSRGRSSSARATRRANRARLRSDTRPVSGRLAPRAIIRQRGAQLAQRTRTDAAHARLRETDADADLAQGELARVRENDDAALELRQRAEPVGDHRPARIDARPHSGVLRELVVADLREAIE